MRVLGLKKYVVIFLGLFLLIPLIAYGASINLGEDCGSPGDTVTIPVTLNYIEGETPNICSIAIDIGFDPDVLENPQVEIGPAGTNADKDVVSNLVTDRLFRIGILSTANRNTISAGIVAYVSFIIKSDAPSGTYTLTNTPSASDPDGNAISVTGADGIVTIPCPSPPPPSALTATHNAPPYVAGGDVTVTNTIEYTFTEDLTALGITVDIPEGWTFVGVGGDDPPAIKPSSGATGPLEFSWITPPDSPISFTYTLHVPEGETGTKEISSEAEYRVGTGTSQYATFTPDPLEISLATYHDADYNPPDWKIELTELLRIIQFYNVGSYHIDPQGEDGFNPGPAPE